MSVAKKRWLVGTSLALALITGVLLRFAWQPGPVQIDEVGYRAASELLATGQGLVWHDAHNRLDARFYTLLAFAVPRSGLSDPFFRYPPGLPALAAMLAALTGRPGAVDLAVPLCGAALVGAATYLAGRTFGPLTGAWAGLLLMLSPAVLRNGTAWWSEIPCASLAYAGLAAFAAVRRTQWPVGVIWALASFAGFLSGAAFLTRTPALSAAPGLIWVAWMLSPCAVGEHAKFRLATCLKGPWCAYAIGLGIMVGALALYNALYLGGPFQTGYTPENNWYAEAPFALDYAFTGATSSAVSVMRSLWQDQQAFLAAGVMGLVWAGKRQERRLSWALLGLAGCALAPYLIYAMRAPRFIVLGLPAICILEGHGIARILGVLHRRGWRWVAIVALGAMLCWRLPAERERILVRNANVRQAIASARTEAALMEPDAVVVAFSRGDLLCYYGERAVLNWRLVTPYDPVQGRYRTDLFAGLLNEEVARLLAADEKVYYLFDAGEPSATVAVFLRERFVLAPVVGSDALFRLGFKS